MAKLVYSTIASADGYVEDAAGNFEWGAPGEELFCFINDLERTAGTYLYGRRMYETMLFWETAHGCLASRLRFVSSPASGRQPGRSCSKTLGSVSSARTRIERDFDPGMIRQVKSAACDDMTVGGADLAGQAIKAGLVRRAAWLFLVPVVVGGGKPALLAGVRLELELLDTRRFACGAVYLRYRPRPA